MSVAANAVMQLVRDGDRDRYVASLFAPAPRRDALLALHAFELELSRIPRLARQQIAGEIRLQWWREAVDGSNEHEAMANPVAAALIGAVNRYGLPHEALHAMIDARGSELVPQPFADIEGLLAWCDGAVGQGVRCACRILDPVRAGEGETAAHHAGRAIGIVQMLMSFAPRAARGQSIMPRDLLARHRASAANVTAGPVSGHAHDGVVAALAEMRALARNNLDEAEQARRTLPPSLHPAFLALALVAPRLRFLERHAHRPYVSGDVPQWRRMWRMWRAARN